MTLVLPPNVKNGLTTCIWTIQLMNELIQRTFDLKKVEVMVVLQLLFPSNLVSRQSYNGSYELDILKIFFEDSRVSEVKPPDDCVSRDEVAIVVARIHPQDGERV